LEKRKISADTPGTWKNKIRVEQNHRRGAMRQMRRMIVSPANAIAPSTSCAIAAGSGTAVTCHTPMGCCTVPGAPEFPE
jgi:hypothetical protein